MIYERDLDEAIAECQGERNPTANTCIKLAAYYTIKNELFGKMMQLPEPSYSYAVGPVETSGQKIAYKSDTEFSQAINGKDVDKVMAVVDELMTTLQAIYPRLYDAAMQKLHT